MEHTGKIYFAPQLFIPAGVKDLDFYSRAFGAEIKRKWCNDDNSIHVAELSIEGVIFHLHEETPRTGMFSPGKYQSSTVIIGMFVPDVDAVMKRAIAAGAVEVSPAQDYDYGYRQGEMLDPFGHRWMIEKQINPP
jgi:PhnB protein